MTHYNLIFAGFGNVGRALARLLLAKRERLRAERQIDFAVTAIFTGRHGGAIDPTGLDLEAALRLIEAGHPLEGLSTRPVPADGCELIASVPGDVLFETIPVNHESGQPALDYLTAALEHGMHAITANKGPVVHGYARLQALAQVHSRRFLFESSVLDGTPVFSLFREAAPAAEVKGFFGILNATSNYVLSRMEAGETFAQAVHQAQEGGFAEQDPSEDIDGWDAAIKVAALATVLMDLPLTPQQVEREGIGGITPQAVAQARQEGKRWKLVCRLRRELGGLQARVGPELVGPGSVLYTIDNDSSYVEFETDVLPGLGILEARPNLTTTAYGLLADFIHAVK